MDALATHAIARRPANRQQAVQDALLSDPQRFRCRACQTPLRGARDSVFIAAGVCSLGCMPKTGQLNRCKFCGRALEGPFAGTDGYCSGQCRKAAPKFEQERARLERQAAEMLRAEQARQLRVEEESRRMAEMSKAMAEPRIMVTRRPNRTDPSQIYFGIGRSVSYSDIYADPPQARRTADDWLRRFAREVPVGDDIPPARMLRFIQQIIDYERAPYPERERATGSSPPAAATPSPTTTTPPSSDPKRMMNPEGANSDDATTRRFALLEID
jgi:hypothetical protein